MGKLSTVDVLTLSKFALPKPRAKAGRKDETWQDMGAVAIPDAVIEAIKAAPDRGKITIDDLIVLSGQVIRCTDLTFDVGSELQWQIPLTADSGDFVAIAAQTIHLNVPADASQLPKLALEPPLTKAELDGADGDPGAPGWTSGVDDGSQGGPGQPGRPGITGRTYEYPSVFIFYETISHASPNPGIAETLNINANGIAGGDGGRGGHGGRGGNGGRGTPGSRKCVLGVCVCTAGPGNGGFGGAGGPGGQGGGAGDGGNGASFFFVGPATSEIDLWAISIPGAPAGVIGQPGLPGDGGSAGGGGSKPFECPQGGLNGGGGPGANPPDNGQGPVGVAGQMGTSFVVARDNTDLFP